MLSLHEVSLLQEKQEKKTEGHMQSNTKGRQTKEER